MYTISVDKKANTLQEIELKPMNDEACAEIHADYVFYDDPDFYEEGIFCAGGEAGKDACGGDSGSALLVKDVGKNKVIQVGIVSGSIVPECGTEGAPGFYTRVSYYLKWILDNVS